MLKAKYLILAVLFSIVLQGCTVSIFTARPTLLYTPVMPKGVSKNISIYVDEFKDNRPDVTSGIIGEIRSAYLIKSGVIEEPLNLVSGVTKAFKEELHNSGYLLSSAEGSDVTIAGEILDLSAEHFPGFGAKILIEIKVIKNGETILNKEYFGESYRMSMALSVDRAFSIVLEESLQIAIKQAVEDIVSLL